MDLGSAHEVCISFGGGHRSVWSPNSFIVMFYPIFFDPFLFFSLVTCAICFAVDEKGPKPMRRLIDTGFGQWG